MRRYTYVIFLFLCLRGCERGHGWLMMTWLLNGSAQYMINEAWVGHSARSLFAVFEAFIVFTPIRVLHFRARLHKNIKISYFVNVYVNRFNYFVGFGMLRKFNWHLILNYCIKRRLIYLVAYDFLMFNEPVWPWYHLCR